MPSSTPPSVSRWDLDGLVSRADALCARGGRCLLGITGAPGAGKSTLAAELAAAVGDRAVLVPMDGFHLAQRLLDDRGQAATKGAIDTFDVGGFVHLLWRLRAADEPEVLAPAFRRDLEEPIAGAIAVPSEAPLVVVEGNYLLADHGAWRQVRSLLDAVWYVEPDDEVRRERLIARHMGFGRDRAEAEGRSLGSDEVNAALVASTRARADLLVVGG